MSLHRYLTRLIWACVLPLLLLVIGLAMFRLSHLQQEDVREATSLAKNVVNAVDEGLTARTRNSALLGQAADLRIAPLDPLYYQNFLDRMALPSGWSIELRDGNGRAIARRAPPDMVADPDTDSPRRFVAASTVLPWSVAVEISAGTARTPLVRASGALAAAIFVATLTAVLGGKWASRRLARSVVSLTQLPTHPTLEPDITEIAMVRRLLSDSLAERDKAEAANSSAQQRFRAIFEQAAVGISIVGPDGHWLLGNQKLCDITGYPLEELLTKTFGEVTHPDDLQADLDQSAQLLAGAISDFSMEKRYIRKDGQVQWIRLTSALVRQRDGTPDFFISIVDDIQDRKRMEDALRDSENQYRSLMAELPIGVQLMGTNSEVLLANAKGLELLALTADQVLGKTAFDPGWNIVHADGTPFAAATLPVPLAIATRQPVHNVVMGVYRTTTQDRIWLQVDAAPQLAANGSVRQVVCTFMDITARRQAEAELARHHAELEQLVATRTDELATAKHVSDAANHVKSEFLATMSHELRTPLNAVMGLTRLLGDSPLSPRQRDYTDKIQSSARALRTLIDDVLDFSKIEAGQLHLESAPFSLDAMLRTTATVMGIGIAGKPVEILFQVAPDVPDDMVGDALRLQQILLNLTSNAIKFTDVGSIVVSVRCLTQSDTQVRLQLSVQDTGIGIPAAQLGPIFEVFKQARASTSRLYGGTGLGLSISARLAHLMGGQITVDSTVGLGSKFHLELPLTLAPGTCATPTPLIRPALRLLIIDDNPMARDVLTLTCGDLGWLATAVDSGAAGLDELRESANQGRDYDVMLLDWRMPEMDGLEMLRQAYSSPDVGLAPVVLMVGAFELEQALAASGDLHIEVIVSKPTTPTSLQEALTRAYAGEHIASAPESRPADERLAGMRLLVAEDNALNQEVIADLLTRSGAEVVLVDHGLAAVDALRAPEARFDAVLMDIQMPVMDGYTATRVIREELGLLELPIIAVTAYARPQDREKSRAAGMVGHIVKPLNVEDLLDLVARERRGAPRQDVPLTKHATPLPDLDIEGAMASFGGDTKRYKELLRKFMDQHGRDTQDARACFDAHDIKGARNLMHGLSGIANLLQASALGSLARDAENALTDGDTAAMPQLWDALQTAMQALSQSIDRFTAQ
jgi:two-component system sensor histidine kinase/response regulator